MRNSLQSIAYLFIGTLVGLVIAFTWQTYKGPGTSFGGDSRTVMRLATHGPGGKYSRDDLQPGDKIKKINGIQIDNGSQAYRVLQALCFAPMDSISVDVIRRDDDGKVIKLDHSVNLDRDDIRSVVLGGMGKKKVECNTFQISKESLFDAASDGNSSAVREYLQSGGRKYIDDLTDGRTPLIAAIEGSHTAVAQELLDFGADINKSGSDGTTPLMQAAEKGNRELAAMLLASGADPTARNSALKTAAEIADANGFSDLSGFIDSPRPTGLLNADQRKKAIDVLNQLGQLKGPAYSVTDEEFGAALKRAQALPSIDMPQTGMLTSSTYDEFMKKARHRLGDIQSAQEEDTTQKTLSRVFSRALMDRWTPVDSASGYPDCNRETVMFQISPDQKTITWASFRPGASTADLQGGKRPTQTQDFRVVRASQADGYDTILVRPDPAPNSGPRYQYWEIRDGSMKVTLKQRDDQANAFGDSADLTHDGSDTSGTHATKYASNLTDRLDDSSDNTTPGSTLMECR